MVKKGGRADIMTKTNNIAPSANVVKESVILGDVSIGENSTVLFHAVLRGDDDSIRVGKYSNIQDNCTVHCSTGHPVVIGDNVSVGHNALLHGCTVGAGSLIGMHSTVMNGASLGKSCLVGAGALVTENKKFEDNSLIIGVPAKAKCSLDENAAARLAENAAHYRRLAGEYQKGGKS